MRTDRTGENKGSGGKVQACACVAVLMLYGAFHSGEVNEQ